MMIIMQEGYKNKLVNIHLTNNYNFTGKVLEEDNDHIKIIDKYNNKVMINKNNIMIIKEI